MPSLLSRELLDLLRCPSCRAPLAEVTGGGYCCTVCQKEYPCVRGVLRFVDTQSYAGSFGYQWHQFDKTQLDRAGTYRSEADFMRKTGLGPDDFRGKLVLDVGCGMGRFAETVTRWGARVVGIDLSAASEVAARNLAERDFVALQADVFSIPFAPESFDCIYSMGVLHHTPDCEKAFKELPQYLKPGGTIAIWLYSGYNNWYRFSDLYRNFTHRMSPQLLLNVLRVAVPFFYQLDRFLRRIPLAGRPLAGLIHHLFPVNRHPDPEIRVLDTFDWYSPKYQSKHRYEEVFRWFESCGLESLSVGEIAIGVRGKKPRTSTYSEPSPERELEARTS